MAWDGPIVDKARAQVVDRLHDGDGLEPLHVFDFGDECRVLQRLRERIGTDGGAYPRVIERVGAAPPQTDERRVGEGEATGSIEAMQERGETIAAPAPSMR